MFSCLVKEFQSVLSRSSVTKFTSVYFGGGESFQIGDWKPSDVLNQNVQA